MDIRKLKYFVSVAETLNFTRSAQENNISQSAISQYIANMENELDFPLFNRGKNGVELTSAGREFYGDIKTILGKYNRAVQNAKAVANNSGFRLGIAYSNPMDMDLLSTIIDDFVERHPDVQVSLVKEQFSRISDMLKNGLCDFAFSFPYDLESLSGIHKIKICSKKMYLVVGKKHPKAGDREIEAEDVGKEKIIMVSRENGQGHYGHILECCHTDVYKPNIAEEVKDYDTYILMVEANKGVGFVSDLNTEVLSRNVSLLEIKNSHHQYELIAAWKEGKEESLKRDFIQSIKKNLSTYKPSADARFPGSAAR